MAILFAIIALVGWGVGDVFVTIATRKLGNYHTYFWGFFCALIFTTFYIPFAGPIKDYQMFFLAIALNIIHTTGNLAYFKSLEIGNASLNGTIGGAFPIISVMISLLFFGEILSTGKWIGFILTMIGIILASFQIGLKNTKTSFFSDKGIPFAIVAFLCWGIYFALVRIPAQQIGWFWAGFPLYLLGFLLLIVKNVRTNLFNIFKIKDAFKNVILFIILVTIADFAYNIGILHGYTSVVASIAGAYPVVFVLLSRMIFKDSLTKIQRVGIVSALTGIVAISSL